MNDHPELQLSAYLDGALSPSERAAIDAHLASCSVCRERLADLRATSRLLAALPQLVPSRSLVARVERAPVWLRPARLLGAIGSGVFVFLFLASAVLNSGGGLGGGTTTAEQLAEKGQFGAAANALASDAAAQRAVTAASGAPAPAAVSAATAGPAQDSARNAAGASATAAPRAEIASTAGPATRSATPIGPPPLLFLGLAAFCAIGGIVAHRRLRQG